MYSNKDFKENQLTQNFVNREDFSNINGYIDYNYFKGIIRETDWNFDNLFKNKSADDVRKHVSIPVDNEVNTLVNTGHTSSQADGNEYAMWSKKNNQAYHYFDDLYKKLACCTGLQGVHIPYSDINGNKQVEAIDYQKAECTINGTDWYDSNEPKTNPNANCEKFMNRLIAYLEINDPGSDIVRKYGGCLANRYVNAALQGKGASTERKVLYDTLRQVFVPECAQSSSTTYKRAADRKDAAVSICDAKMEVGNMMASGNQSQIALAQQINQNCTVNTQTTTDGQGNTTSNTQLQGADTASTTTAANNPAGGQTTTTTPGTTSSQAGLTADEKLGNISFGRFFSLLIMFLTSTDVIFKNDFQAILTKPMPMAYMGGAVVAIIVLLKVIF